MSEPSPFATLAPDGHTVFWYQSDAHVRTPEEAERSAARKRRKEEKAMPLFAPVIETVSTRLKTPEQIIDEDEHRWDKLAAVDRKGAFRSRLASSVLRLAMHNIGFDYLTRRPPCFLDEPYEIRWLLSYCDTRLHKGTIYRAAGFKLYRTNSQGIQTWRVRLPALTASQDRKIRRASEVNPRSIRYRAAWAQMKLFEA